MVFGVDLSLQTFPDSMFVGGLGSLNLSVSNLDIPGAVPVFNEQLGDSDAYSLINKSLNENSVEYTIQFWSDGIISIPPILVEIKHNHHIIDEIFTDTVFVKVYSNLSASSKEMRGLKPLKEVQLISGATIIIYGLFIFVGLIITLFLWKKKRNKVLYLEQSESFTISPLLECVKTIESAAIPEKITRESTEKFYLDITKVCREYLNKLFYVKATEMTSKELDNYFQTSGIEEKLLQNWNKIIHSADVAKYGGYVPEINQFNEDKQQFITLMKAFQKFKDGLEREGKIVSS